MTRYLNIGCDQWKLNGFINIDLNPKVNPDLLLDLTELHSHFGPNSVDFIYAGHVFEHFKHETSQEVMTQCYSVLNKFRCLLAVVPDWRKTIDVLDEAEAEKIILANGDHLTLMSAERLRLMLKKAGFSIVQEIKNLNEIPYLIVSNNLDPVADPWQSAFLALKI